MATMEFFWGFGDPGSRSKSGTFPLPPIYVVLHVLRTAMVFAAGGGLPVGPLFMTFKETLKVA